MKRLTRVDKLRNMADLMEKDMNAKGIYFSQRVLNTIDSLHKEMVDEARFQHEDLNEDLTIFPW